MLRQVTKSLKLDRLFTKRDTIWKIQCFSFANDFLRGRTNIDESQGGKLCTVGLNLYEQEGSKLKR